MTDLETMLEMLKRGGVYCELEIVGRGIARAGETVVRVYGGYDGYCSEIYFSPDGTLTSIEAYG